MRYERCAQSLVGEGGRSDGPWAVAGGGNGSGEVGIGGGVRIGGRSLELDRESAWKNWLSDEALPMADNGGEGTVCLGLSSCLPSA